MHPIEVYRINKESVVCESAYHLQVPSFDRGLYLTDRLGDIPTEARIKNEYWKIKVFAEAEDLGYGNYKRIDKYIAVDPVLEKLLTMELTQKHEQRYNEMYNKYLFTKNKLLTEISAYESRIDNFKKLPWYKRIWRAITLDI